ncbi:MAG: nitrate reductase [Bdellovibrionales bacterium RIFOXYD12_FULL_39_22]|nr:MAG: nitrate reductase [Bdellovibrionales bacterium RIFOXYB1_FULL_39_21]OFZ42640.1 MAG: nitrate reductase [Bdellovibrionales bacterium RIFOXYC12_FULL_39_17]OFZ47092.1 MAG: nitrate reductase [Bdellovibrionales bacterium RIFOXYC1_FULL_39_130]OFZ75340.1 MAG: nitrate reductase [Bdellovibrionales bacterium RIFOXYD1_FULL_39_84]OFZ93291.1 MAG: nitrate reductase [Bdellovibrionales bacterium RIFOXYD12_FULL_39_22]HLE10034.1 molybdopterin-dependent oxidoreductase [Bacteriovoracaceae bacterium]
MSNFNRRDFIKISSAATVSASVGLNTLANSPTVAKIVGDLAEPGASSRTPTYCEICFWQCAGWVVKDKDGRPWKIVGNEEDQHSLGRMCTRGSGGLGAYLDPDRLKKPLIRSEERGKQVFREASWEEAFNYIAKKMEAIATQYGPDRVCLFSHGCGGPFFKTLINAYGSENVAAPSYAQCRGPRQEAFGLTFGADLGSPENTDIKNAKCLVLMGSHLGENLHNTQVQEFGQAIEAGCTIITVDPRFSVAAGKSKYWLPIKPSTDLALVLSWIHCLIEEEIYNKDYVKKYTIGFEKLKAEVASYTPEWAYSITSIKPEIIRQTAREMAQAAPAVIVHPSRHVAWYGDDTQRMRGIAILNALLGGWGHRGGFYQLQKAGVPECSAPLAKKAKNNWRGQLDGKYPLASMPPANFLCDKTVEGYYKGWFVYGTNLSQCLPEPQKTEEAISKLDLLVVIDTMPAEITGWADVVLPECTYLERFDELRDKPGRRRQIALRAPAFEPLYDSKPAWWIAKNLAITMGIGAAFPWANIEELLNDQLAKLGTSMEEMKKVGVKNLGEEGALCVEDGLELHFKTKSGKIELYSQTLEDLGFDPIPKYTAHETPPDGYYRLIYGRTPTHTFGRTINNPILNQVQAENDLWVHPTVAKRWNLQNGQYVKVKNQAGVASLPIRVRITERIRNDALYMAHGFGHTDKRLSRAHLKGANDTALIDKVKVDPIMGATGFRGTFVTFDEV